MDRIGAHVSMRAGSKRHGFIQKVPGPGDHALAALRIVPFALCLAVSRNGVGAVERVIQRAPSRIGCIECVPRIANRHHKLRAGDSGDFRVDIRSIDLESRTLGHEIADLPEKRFVSGLVEVAAAPSSIPVIDLCLQLVTPLQQRAIERSELLNDAVQAPPKRRRLDAGAGKYFMDDEIVENFCDLQAGNGYALNFRHRAASSFLKCALPSRFARASAAIECR